MHDIAMTLCRLAQSDQSTIHQCTASCRSLGIGTAAHVAPSPGVTDLPPTAYSPPRYRSATGMTLISSTRPCFTICELSRTCGDLTNSYVYYGSRDPIKTASSSTIQLYALSSSGDKLLLVHLKEIISFLIDQRFCRLRRRLYPGMPNVKCMRTIELTRLGVILRLPAHLFWRNMAAGPHGTTLLSLRYVPLSQLTTDVHDSKEWGSVISFSNPKREPFKYSVQAR